MSVRTPLLRPARYFRTEDRRVHGKHVLGLYVAVVVLDLNTSLWVLNWWTGEVPWIALLIFTVALFPALLLLIGIVIWTVIAAAMHYLTGGDRTEGTLRQALDVAGWAFAPVLLVRLVSIPVSWYALAQVRAPTRSEMMTNAHQLHGGYVELIEPVPTLGTTIWGVYILTFGVAVTHDVPPRRAIVPALLIGLVRVWNTVSSFP